MAEPKKRTYQSSILPLANLQLEHVAVAHGNPARDGVGAPESKKQTNEREEVLSRLIERIKSI